MNEDRPVTTSEKRKRVARACDACYQRKIKCDAASPRCDWCAHNDSPCTYERKVVRKKGSSKDDRARLLDRIDRLEKILKETLERESRETSPHGQKSILSFPYVLDHSLGRRSSAGQSRETSVSRDSLGDRSCGVATPITSLGTLHFAGRSLGTINSNTGIPVFSDEGQRWIRSRTGENASLERIGALSRSWHSSTHSAWDSPPSMHSTRTSIELPDRRIVEAYLDLYQHAFTCHIFPVVDPLRFRNTIAVAYAPKSASSSYQEYNAQACVYAFLAFLSFFNFGDHVGQIANADEYALKAHEILTVCCLDVSVEMLQAASLLTMFHLFSGKLHYALFQTSLCARMIYMLGAHTTTYPSCTDPNVISTNSSYRERYLLRNIFWIIHSLDKELSLRTGQPPCLQDEHCDMTLPPPHVPKLYPHIMGYQVEETYDTLHLFPGHPELSKIKSKAYSALYSTHAVRKPDNELLRDIRELDDDLECWRLSIPLTHRPTLSFTRTTLPEGSASTMLSVMLHLDYCHCVAAIHQATSRCQAWNFGDHDEAGGVGTSLALSIEASRSSLSYLRRACRFIDDDSFWMILYYPMSALLTVFYSILHRPLDPMSLQDLELLTSVPSIIREIPARRLTKNETTQIQLIDELVESLSTLGRCAINKAMGDLIVQAH